MAKRKVTIQDIANHAKVGVGTVSRVLNDSPDVSAHTRQRVLQAIEELEYRPSFAARLMRTGTSNIIGFITDAVASTPYAVDIIKGAQSVASASDKLLLVVNSDGDTNTERWAVEALLERGVEGIIYAAMYHHEVAPPDAIRQVPTVLLDCFDARQSFPSVVPDEVGAARQAADILLAKGHRRIAFLNLLPRSIPAHSGRLTGFWEGLQAAGVYDPELVFAVHDRPPGGYDVTRELMQRPDPPTAIFCGTDRIAMTVYNALCELRLRIPDDVAVMGFDNLALIAEGLNPPLSTIALPHYQMGRWAVQYLLENRDELEPIQLKMECPYVERASV